jgi:DNA polymerase elongation subunit (family B)
VVHNTDSVFVNFGDVSYDRVQQLGKEASELVTKKLLKPNKLEFEKWLPYAVMIEKKMYAFLKVLGGDTLFNLEAKGLA